MDNFKIYREFDLSRNYCARADNIVCEQRRKTRTAQQSRVKKKLYVSFIIAAYKFIH